MTTTTRAAVALAGALALAVGVGGCSTDEQAATTTAASASSSTTAASASSSTTAASASSSSAAARILEKARSNALSARSGAFTGEVQQGKEKMQISFKGTSDGKTADVAIAMGTRGKVRLIAVGGGIYMQADETFWKNQKAPASVQKAGDKFVKAPASAASLTSSLNLTAFLKEAFGAVTASKLSDVVTSASVGGVDCWVLTDKQGARNGALYVSKRAYELVRFTGSPSSPGQLDFSRWNQDVGVTAPPASQIITIR
ncbi:MAG TPA: hypothetical protein VFJ94_16205 [Intrasporangium sp.]|uniref:hypothetical protein n=1 Tax=Intrasporangium sp. TaxID=1925024 RepID=UPI002D777667|nr:hypothetical protein [Intrasporangium sp.]HET7400060.1 hypothetical protein [Intrasporangium sp.]